MFLLTHLEDTERYSQITSISMYQLTRSDCSGVCRTNATLNAMRGSILEGDSELASFLGNAYLTEHNNSAVQDSGIYKIKMLTTYAYALNDNISAFQINLASLDTTSQNKLLRLIQIDAPVLSNVIEKKPSVFADMTKSEADSWKNFEQIPKKSPWVAGVSNLVIPGFGYAYLNMWQTAFIDAFITGLCVASTIELARHKEYWTAAAVGTVGSVFYVGGALGAARSANDINQRNSKEVRTQLRGFLLPELKFNF